MKPCIKCKAIKPVEEFYAHPQMGDGHLNKCKDCTKKDSAARIEVKKLDPVWTAKERERGRLKMARVRATLPRHPHVKFPGTWRKRNPEKGRAHCRAWRAFKKGILVKPPACTHCQQVRPLQMHHPDYSQPLLVVWLCTACHGKEHRIDKAA